MTKQALDMEKLKNLIHYICYKTDSDNLGKIKLNKVLWFSDALFYLDNRRSITGETYVKGQYGPMSKNILQALRELANERRVFESDVTFYNGHKKEYAVLKNPDLSSFTAAEISRVDDVISLVCDSLTAREVSDFTHNEIWEAAEMEEELPFGAVVFERIPAEPSPSDVEWARRRAAERNLASVGI